MLRTTLATLAIVFAVTTPAFAEDPPNGVDDDPATVTGRPSDKEMHSAISFIYSNMAAGFGAKVYTGSIHDYGRIWRRVVVRIEGKNLKLRFSVKMTETVDGFDFYANVLR